MELALIKFYDNRIIKRDLVNKLNFLNKKSYTFPKLKSIAFNFGAKNNDLKTLAKLNLALEVLAGVKSRTTLSRKPDLFLKKKKNSPAGASLTLRGKKMHEFLYYFMLEIKPKLKLSATSESTNFVTFTINSTELFLFEGLEFNRHLFFQLPNLTISVVFNKKLANTEKNFTDNFTIKPSS